MSAIQLPAIHIAALIGTGWNERDFSPRFGTCTQAAQLLAQQNAASVGTRYNECTQALVIPERLIVRFRAYPLPRADFFKALDSYEYQSCEAPDWRMSTAKDLCQSLRAKAIRQLPGYEQSNCWIIEECQFTNWPHGNRSGNDA